MDQDLIARAVSAGKYAIYIWPAYAVSAAGFAWLIIDTLVRAAVWKRRADRLSKDDGGEGIAERKST